MVTISLCMIVKNEEENLARCLSSYAPFMDEMIVVDTGSTDKTKEIAKQFTDKIYDFDWINDFSAARNYAFSKATCEYIFSADADEILEGENALQFSILKKVLDPEIEIVQMKYGNQLENGTIYNYDCELRPKLFKRLRTFTWIEPIHETVRTLPVVFDSDIVITHKPKTVHTQRDIKAFEMMVEKHMSISDRLHTIYAKELFVSGEEQDFIRAIPFFKESIQDDTRLEDAKLEAVCVLAKAYRLLHDDANFFKYSVLCDIGVCSEQYYEIGQYYYEKEDYEEALRYFTLAADHTMPILNLKYQEVYAPEKKQACQKKLGNITQ